MELEEESSITSDSTKEAAKIKQLIKRPPNKRKRVPPPKGDPLEKDTKILAVKIDESFKESP